MTGQIWYCDGENLKPQRELPLGYSAHHTFSMYYCNGYGFWLLNGDATDDPRSETWRPLNFEHDNRNYSSYLTNAGQQSTLRCQRNDQRWPRMLLPDIYQVHSADIPLHYGGLKGDLGILLALIAFSMGRDDLKRYLGRMFINGVWQVHGVPHGRMDKRGVVVYVYAAPGVTTEDLKIYENGDLGFYYN